MIPIINFRFFRKISSNNEQFTTVLAGPEDGTSAQMISRVTRWRRSSNFGQIGKLPSPHPQPPFPMGGGGPPDGGLGEGLVADRTALLGGLRFLATLSCLNVKEELV